MIVVAILSFLFALWLGRTSNGMTSPRAAFNIYTGPFAGILGAIVGLFSITPAFSLHALGVGFIVGLVAGLAGLGIARLSR